MQGLSHATYKLSIHESNNLYSNNS